MHPIRRSRKISRPEYVSEVTQWIYFVAKSVQRCSVAGLVFRLTSLAYLLQTLGEQETSAACDEQRKLDTLVVKELRTSGDSEMAWSIKS